MARRIRKHANPFNVLTKLGTLDRIALFGRKAPLEVDLGCGGASYLFQRAQNHPDRDFVGIEVRKPLVEATMRRRDQAGLTNLHVFYANAHENIELAEPGVIRCFHVHFPDPCFKKRHHKRRIVQPSSVRKMAKALTLGGHIYVQTDVLPLAEEMAAFLEGDGALRRMTPTLTAPRPFPETTEWERHHDQEQEPIYRMLFTKVREPVGQIAVPDFKNARPEASTSSL